MFKKPSKAKNVRKRPTKDEDGEDDGEGSAVVVRSKQNKRAGLDGKLNFSSGIGQARSSVKDARRDQDEQDGDGDGAQLKTTFAYESERMVQVSGDSKATATNETETEFDRDARAIREKVLKQAAEAINGGKADDKVYRGQAGYKDHTAGFRREHSVANEKASGAFGPLRASTNVRMSVRFDYQPDICKDYKETGYCGYGDSCKFMHDRGDYKSGWQMDREWEEKEKKRKAALAMGLAEDDEDGNKDSDDGDDEDELPFACFICREPFVDPVVTRCKHYFCEHCALKHNARNKNCYVCNKPTNGIFNTAHEIIRKSKEVQGEG